jgi:antitoxin (DNA-binding transcriptional repressor) of toxin-antitoxin stability system
MRVVTLAEAKEHLPDLLEAAVGGAEVVIVDGDQQAVKLVPVQQVGARPQFGSAKGLITMSDDFDAPLDDFAEYLQ